MAANRLNPQALNVAGIVPAYAVAGAGAGQLNVTDVYSVNNDGKTFLHAKKGAAVDAILTFNTPGTVDGLAVAERTVTIPASTGDKMIGPFAPETYNQPGTSDLQFTIDNIASLTIAVIRLP